MYFVKKKQKTKNKETQKKNEKKNFWFRELLRLKLLFTIAIYAVLGIVEVFYTSWYM